MSALTPKMTSALPADTDTNGLSELSEDLVADPTSTHVAIVVFDVKGISLDVDSGDSTPTIRLTRIEPITDPEAKQRLGDLATRAYNRRTGQSVLPLDLEDEIRSVFGGLSDLGNNDGDDTSGDSDQ